ncbi:MAG: hypothetical protein AB7R90_04145 [Reyranellaceae bacterium]
MPRLPDKFSLRGGAVPDGRRDIANIGYETPLAGAGRRFAGALADVAGALGKDAAEKEENPAAEARAVGEAVRLIQTAQQDFDATPDPGQAGIHAAEFLEQGKAKILGGLGPQAQALLGPTIESLVAGKAATIGHQIAPRQREQRIGEFRTLSETLVAQHAALKDETARQEIGMAAFGHIGKLRAVGDIDDVQAEAMKRDLQRRLVLADVQAQPAAWRIEKLQPGQEGEARWFRDTLGAEEADFQLAQARQEHESEMRDGAVRSLLQEYGTSPASEQQALAAIRDRHGNDPKLLRYYGGALEVRRWEERRGMAQAAANAYRLALEGREEKIAPADRKRLHDTGQLEGVLEAAQYARVAPPKGELLFRERFLAMGEAERVRYGVAELAKRLSPQDFLEVVQGAAGEDDQTQHERMRDFVLTVQPMLRAVTLGEKARPEQIESDRLLLKLIHDELNVRVSDAEQQKKRKLSPSEHRLAVEDAARVALLRQDRMEREQAMSLLRVERKAR